MVDIVWKDRPTRPHTPVWQLPVNFAGMSTADKKKAIAAKMTSCDHLLLTALDQIAWFMNLRAEDIEYNPVFFSYAIFNKESNSVDLFADAAHW